MSRNGRSKRKTAAKLKKPSEQSKLRKLDKDSFYDDTVNIDTSSASDSDDDVVLLDELSTKKFTTQVIIPVHTSDTSWCDRYAPLDRASLVVHKQKLTELENCLVSILDAKSSSSKHSSNILVLTGPSGCEKTSALRVLADEMGVKLIEWHRVAAQHVWSPFSNGNLQSTSHQGYSFGSGSDDLDEFASETRVFERFLMNAIRRNTLELDFEHDADADADTLAATSRDSRPRASNGRAIKPEKTNTEKSCTRQFPGSRLVLVRELPTAYFMNVSAFHALLQIISRQPRSIEQPVCVAFVVATQTVPFRGALESDSRQELNAWRTTKRDAFDTLFPLGSLRSRGVTPSVVRFNAITALNAQRALNAICERECANGNSNVARLDSDALSALVRELVASSNSDIRCAVNALQFRVASSVHDTAVVTSRRRKVAHAHGSRTTRGAVSQIVKDDRLSLFRAVGRLLYYDPAKYGRPAVANAPAPVPAPANDSATLSSLIQLDDGAMVEDALYRSDVADSFDFFAAMLHEAYCDVFVDTESVACLANAFSETDALGGSSLQLEHRRAVEPDRVSVLTRSFVDVHARTTVRARRTFAAYRASTALRLQRAVEECRKKVTDSLLRADSNTQDNDRFGTALSKTTYTLGVDAAYRNGATLYSEILPFAALIALPNRSHLSLSFAQKSTLFAVAHFDVNKRRPAATPADPLDDENAEDECGTSRLMETGSEDDPMHVLGSQLNAPNMYLDDVYIEDPDS